MMPAEVLDGLLVAAFGLTAHGEDVLQLLGPLGVEERIDDALGEGTLLHFAFDDAGAADGPEGMYDGADALMLDLGDGDEFACDFRLHAFEFREVVRRDEDLISSGGRWFGGSHVRKFPLCTRGYQTLSVK